MFLSIINALDKPSSHFTHTSEPSTWSLHFHFSIPIHFLPLKRSFKIMWDYTLIYFRSLQWAQSLIWPLLVCPGLPDISFSLAAPCLKVLQLRGVPPHSRAHFSPHLQITSVHIFRSQSKVPPGASSYSSGLVKSLLCAFIASAIFPWTFMRHIPCIIFFQSLHSFSPLCLHISKIVLGASEGRMWTIRGHHYLIRHTLTQCFICARPKIRK